MLFGWILAPLLSAFLVVGAFCCRTDTKVLQMQFLLYVNYESAGDCKSPEAPCPFRDKGVSRSQERVMFHIFSHMSVCTDAALDWGLWLKMQNKPFAEARPLRPFVGRAAFWGCFGRVGLHRPSLRLPSSRFPLSLVVFPLGFCFPDPLRSGNFGA